VAEAAADGAQARAMETRRLGPQNPKDRFDVYRFFNGMSAEGKAGLNKGQLRVPLAKTFLLEHVSRRTGQPRPVAEIVRRLDATAVPLDDTFMELRFTERDPADGQMRCRTTGYLEVYDERFFAYYTCEDSSAARKRVNNWVLRPDLDCAWFSSFLLQVLWNDDVSKRGNDRYGKLIFRHESIFEAPVGATTSGADDARGEEAEASEDDNEDETEDGEGAEPASDDRPEQERRRARFEMKDLIGRISRALRKLQENYDPLHALCALRLPSRCGPGGHDLYQTGQITNRTDSFEEHRQTARYLYRIYRAILTRTEDVAWQDVPSQDSATRSPSSLKGVPLIVEFPEEIPEATFKTWVRRAFQKKNQFKLWGEPIWLGPKKVHVYGADRHLWQPINLELTSRGVVAILPQGTCGNTFHRLVTNIQHYVSPKIKAWLGSEPFEDLVSKWPSNAGEDDEAD
jgi:hypothetical protein